MVQVFAAEQLFRRQVRSAIGAIVSGVSSVFGRSGAVTAQNGDYTASQVTNVPSGGIAAVTVQTALNELDTEKANLASPTFTGTPAAPTAAAGTNTTQIATTAFVTTAATGQGANPTGTIGLSAVNGAATTYVRSDGAPALSQAIAPTWTALHTWTATAGGAKLLGAPNISGSYLGLTQKWGLLGDLTAANATGPEGTAHFNMTSATGSGNITDYFKTALSSSITVNNGSASGWASVHVATLGNGGSARGGIVGEFDLNNYFGNYTGAPANPYSANLLLTGQNTNGSTGGYSSAALIISFAQNTNPMWNYGIWSGVSGKQVYNTAFIADETNSPTVVLVTGSHTTGVDLSGGTFSGNAWVSPGARITGAGVGSFGYGLSTADAHIEIGEGRSGSGNSYLDLVGDTTYTDYGLRLIRTSSGANADSTLTARGTGALNIVAEDAGSIVMKTNGSTRLTISSAGSVTLGTDLAVTEGGTGASTAADARTNLGYAESTYSPTLTNGTNVAGSTAYTATYAQWGNRVWVWGRFDLDPTAANASTVLGISLPVASNFANAEDCAGGAWIDGNSGVNSAGGIFANTTSDRAEFRVFTPTANNAGYAFQFSYRVI